MSAVLKTITANFETIDLAELAARDIKRDFDQVKAITIKYKNVPHGYNRSRDRDMDDTLVEGFAAAAPIAGIAPGMGGTGTFPGVFPIAGVLTETRYSDQHDSPEIEQSTESHLIIKAADEQTRTIESHLRSMGGLHITVS